MASSFMPLTRFLQNVLLFSSNCLVMIIMIVVAGVVLHDDHDNLNDLLLSLAVSARVRVYLCSSPPLSFSLSHTRTHTLSLRKRVSSMN